VVVALAVVFSLVVYTPPVDAVVTDRFRPPPTPYAAGNRGIDYDTAPGQPVVAAAAGEVVFAGRVGRSVHAVVLHADGLRTSYSFLDGVSVHRGQRVERGDKVGTAGESLHFGVRDGDVYLDPMTVLGASPNEPRHAYLVPDDAAPVDERAALPVAPAPPLECTAAEVDATPAANRRLVMLVGGLGSATGQAAVLAVDTRALGYRDTDVAQFSYRSDGGPYRPDDTTADIDASARLLATRVRELARAHPGVPIDVIAHSQGGLVARAALAGGMTEAATIITLGTPHRGVPLASGAALLNGTATGRAAFVIAGAVGVDPSATSVREMAEGSAFLRRLDQADPRPPTTRVLSIAAASDAVVPAARTSIPPALGRSTTVDLEGDPTAHDHDRLARSAAARREIALAIAGQPPTCRSGDVVVRQARQSRVIEAAQRSLSAALAAAAAWSDVRLGIPLGCGLCPSS
jgi:pimeloyl-ACP methyl ester carboxylesterase